MLHAREYLGQFEAEQLVLWLQTNQLPRRNGSFAEKDFTPEFRRVIRLLTYLKEAQKLRREQPKPNKAERIVQIPLIKEVNQLLRRYTYRLRLLTSLETRFVEARPPAVSPSEEMAAMHMVKLSELGLLDRIQPCGWCTSWFFAKFRHQKFCKQACQQKAYSVGPEWRKQRREYMRKYRRDNS